MSDTEKYENLENQEVTELEEPSAEVEEGADSTYSKEDPSTPQKPKLTKKKKKIITIVSSVVAVILVVVIALSVWLTTRNNGGIDMTNPLSAVGLKPGSYNVVVGEDGVKTYVPKDAADMPERTVNYEIPTDPEALKELAYILYSIGNKTMVTVPYASYFETGKNNSGMGEYTIPLNFNTIDIRNNVTGEHYRQTIQVVDGEADVSPIISGMMSAFGADCAQRWYVVAGEQTNVYEKTVSFSGDDSLREPNWSKLKELNKDSVKRKEISYSPIPYTASGFQGKINGATQTEANINGMKWVYDEATGYSIPVFTDEGGREIGYEKTDQHIFYSTGDDANKYDSEGNLVEEDYYNTIYYAEITYNAEEGYYTVYIKMDSTKDYTHKDTAWALQDADGAKDPSAKFTKLEVKFELWDNGYFKSWEMWEDWYSAKAQGFMSMSAEQHYSAVFSYEEDDADFSKYYNA